MKTAIKNLEIAIVSDLYSAGYTVDGDEYIAEIFYISAEDFSGNRWSLGGWKSAKPEACEETGEVYFCNIKNEAEALAQSLLNRIQKAGAVDLDRWNKDRPAYGSVAYQQYGQKEQVALEKRIG